MGSDRRKAAPRGGMPAHCVRVIEMVFLLQLHPCWSGLRHHETASPRLAFRPAILPELLMISGSRVETSQQVSSP